MTNKSQFFTGEILTVWHSKVPLKGHFSVQFRAHFNIQLSKCFVTRKLNYMQVIGRTHTDQKPVDVLFTSVYATARECEKRTMVCSSFDDKAPFY